MASQLEANRTLLQEATVFKDSGNEHYVEKDYRSAMRCYHKCLLKARCLVQLPAHLAPLQAATRGKRKSESEEGGGEAAKEPSSPVDKDLAASLQDSDETTEEEAVRTAGTALLVSCYNNLAACLLAGADTRPETYLRAVDYAEKVLEREAGNEKALFRKAKGLHLAGELEKAAAAYDACKTNAEAQRLKRQAKEELAEKRRAAREEIAANFAKAQHFAAADAPAPAPPQHNGHLPNGNALH